MIRSTFLDNHRSRVKTNKKDSQKDEQFWRQINLLARSYLQLQQTRIGAELRLMSMEDQVLKDKHLIRIIEDVKVDETTGKKTISRKKEVVDDTEETKQKIEQAKEEIKESDPYRILQQHAKQLLKQEKAMLKDAVDTAKGSALHDFCQRVKGYGAVATLTLLGYINPTTMTSPAKMWSNFGLTPGSRMKKGEQANYNPKVKGRIWMITRNVIMAKDPYYTEFYHIKKEYLKKRPDLMALKQEHPKGWNAKINGMAYRVLMKLMLSHAWEIIYESYHGSKWSDNPDYRYHRNYIPIKPEDPDEWDKYHKMYQKSCDMLLEELVPRYPATEQVEQTDKKTKGKKKSKKKLEEPASIESYNQFMQNAKVAVP